MTTMDDKSCNASTVVRLVDKTRITAATAIEPQNVVCRHLSPFPPSPLHIIIFCIFLPIFHMSHRRVMSPVIPLGGATYFYRHSLETPIFKYILIHNQEIFITFFNFIFTVLQACTTASIVNYPRRVFCAAYVAITNSVLAVTAIYRCTAIHLGSNAATRVVDVSARSHNIALASPTL